MDADDVVNINTLLPDELLLAVFASIGDAASLLDGVPLVCRRWRRLAQDPGAWAGVDLDWPPLLPDDPVIATALVDDEEEVVLVLNEDEVVVLEEEEGGDEEQEVEEGDEEGDETRRAALLDATRTLLRAPALHTLRLKTGWVHGDLGRIASALRRGVVSVRHLDATVWRWGGEEEDAEEARDAEALLALLRRSRGRLRTLAVQGCAASPAAWWAGVWAELPSLRRLQELNVRGAVFYDGQLAGVRLPRLRRLAMTCYGVGTSQDVLLADVLRASTATLRELVVPDGWGWDLLKESPQQRQKQQRQEEAVSQAVAACRELRAAFLPLEHLPAVLGAQHLRCLDMVVGHHQRWHPIGEDGVVAEDGVVEDPSPLSAACVHALRTCRPLANLRELGVSLLLSGGAGAYAACSGGSGNDRALLDACASLGRLAGSASALDLQARGDRCLSGVVEPFLRALLTGPVSASVEVIDLEDFPVRLLAVLADMPRLRRVSGAVFCWKRKQHKRPSSCFECWRAVQDFTTRLRLDVDARGLHTSEWV